MFCEHVVTQLPMTKLNFSKYKDPRCFKMLCYIDWQVLTSASEEHNSSIFSIQPQISHFSLCYGYISVTGKKEQPQCFIGYFMAGHQKSHINISQILKLLSNSYICPMAKCRNCSCFSYFIWSTSQQQNYAVLHYKLLIQMYV